MAETSAFCIGRRNVLKAMITVPVSSFVPFPAFAAVNKDCMDGAVHSLVRGLSLDEAMHLAKRMRMSTGCLHVQISSARGTETALFQKWATHGAYAEFWKEVRPAGMPPVYQRLEL